MSGADGAADSHDLDKVAGSEHDQTSDRDFVCSRIWQGPGSTALALTQVLMFEQKNLICTLVGRLIRCMDFGTTELGEWSVELL